jgi:hypothetical protein
VLSAQVLIAVCLTSCSFFSRTKSQFYSLERVPGTVVSVRGLPIGIDSVELPPGFDRREIIVRKANQQLEVRETQQWSAALEPMVLHTLAFDLAGRLPEGMVILPGAAKPGAAMRSIDVVFEELAAGPERNVILDAHWVLREAGVSNHERIVIDIDSLDSAQIATGVSRAVAALADRIAAGLTTSGA